MKALTLTQPYATLVAVGAKRIETRSWKHWYRGWLAIHAANSFPPDAREACFHEPFKSVLAAAGIEMIWREEKGAPGRARSDLPLGAVVAVAHLVTCLPTESLLGNRFPDWQLSEQERAFGNYGSGRFGWCLDEVRPLQEPIPAKGALGLWEWTPPAHLKELFEALV